MALGIIRNLGGGGGGDNRKFPYDVPISPTAASTPQSTVNWGMRSYELSPKITDDCYLEVQMASNGASSDYRFQYSEDGQSWSQVGAEYYRNQNIHETISLASLKGKRVFFRIGVSNSYYNNVYFQVQTFVMKTI